MSHDFAYQCPHCQESIHVSDDVLGTVVDCPVCDSPFKVDVPTADPARSSELGPDTPVVDRPEREEGHLIVSHPSMLRAHPLKFFGYSALMILGIAAIVMGTWNYHILSQTFQIVAGSVLFVIGGGMMLVWFLQTRYTTLTVTSKRTILRTGIIAKNTTEVQHDDVRNLQVEQNMYERLVHVGDIAVSSSGQDDLEINVDGIPEPAHVAETIRELQ